MRVFRFLLLPIYALQIFSGYKSFNTPVIGSRRLNRRGLHVWRAKMTHRITAWRRRRLQHMIPDADRAAFARDGFVEKRDVLPAEDHAALLAELRALSAPAREMIEGKAVTRRIEVTPALLARMPALRRLLDTPEWRGLTRYVGGFDIEPLICIQTILGAAGIDSPSDPQTQLHMDTFHPTMKAWYFLESVEADQGPFTYVPGSHIASTRRLAWHKRRSVRASLEADKGGSFRIPDAQLKLLRLPNRQVFSVPRNTLVVGDTFGLHARGPSLRASTRVEIYASMRPNPFNPLLILDTALLPFVSGRKLSIGWWLEDALVRCGLTRRIWRDVGNVNPWAHRQDA